MLWTLSPRALLLELVFNLLERGPIRQGAVPAHEENVYELAVDDIGRRKRGPHVLI